MIHGPQAARDNRRGGDFQDFLNYFLENTFTTPTHRLNAIQFYYNDSILL